MLKTVSLQIHMPLLHINHTFNKILSLYILFLPFVEYDFVIFFKYNKNIINIFILQVLIYCIVLKNKRFLNSLLQKHTFFIWNNEIQHSSLRVDEGEEDLLLFLSL